MMTETQRAHNAGLEKAAQVCEVCKEAALEHDDKRVFDTASVLADQIRNLKITH